MAVRSPGLLAVLAIFAPVWAGRAAAEERSRLEPVSPTDDQCALLDSPEIRAQMDGLLFNLILRCDRQDLLGRVAGHGVGAQAVGDQAGPDVRVHRPEDDIGQTSTQSETSIAENLDTGTFCAGYNDSCELNCADGGGGFTGFSRSTDGGRSWDDRGALDAGSRGDPSLVWRQVDGHFYFATLHTSGGLALYRSTDDCLTFSLVTLPSSGADDKELLAVDNTGGPHDGNLYLVWKDFGAGSVLGSSRSTDGGMTWSSQVSLGPGTGPWPVVAPNGDVYVAYVDLTTITSTFKVARSTDGGMSYAPVTDPTGPVATPRDSAATSSCGRLALNGNLRYFPLPQIAATVASTSASNGGPGVVLHIVYSYDPDGQDVGDTIDVFYRRSVDNGATWSPEVRVNDDVTSRDQYGPALFASGSEVIVDFYDRRLDPGNLLFDRYRASSSDGGLTWEANERLSDVSSPVVLDGALATCYHGDYDQSLIASTGERISLWSDDREAPDLADVYSDGGSVTLFADGFESGDTSAWTATIP